MKAVILARLTSPAPATYPTADVRVPAGFPSPAQDYSATTLDLNEVLIHDRAATFILRVYGDSMVDAGISDGDEIIVDRSLEPYEGAIVVAALDGEFTVKRFRRSPDGRGWLLPENPAYPAIPISEHADFMIFGVVTRCLHHVG